MTGDRKAPSLFVREPQFVDKPIFLIIWGLGRSPKRGEGGSPTLSPFPRGRGLGLGIEKFHYSLKNKLFLQSETPSLFVREPDCISLTSGEILLVKSEDCYKCTVVLFVDEVLYIV